MAPVHAVLAAQYDIVADIVQILVGCLARLDIKVLKCNVVAGLGGRAVEPDESVVERGTGDVGEVDVGPFKLAGVDAFADVGGQVDQAIASAESTVSELLLYASSPLLPQHPSVGVNSDHSLGLDKDRPVVVLHVDVPRRNVPRLANTTTTAVRRVTDLVADPALKVEPVVLQVLARGTEDNVLEVNVGQVVGLVLVLRDRAKCDTGTAVASNIAGGDGCRVGLEGEAVVAALVDHAVWGLASHHRTSERWKTLRMRDIPKVTLLLAYVSHPSVFCTQLNSAS